MQTLQEVLDYMSQRVTLSAIAGGTGGLTLAQLRGYHFPSRTAGYSAVSCAAVATACFGFERAANATLILTNQWQDENKLRYASHAAGGLFGGALLGTLYIRKPIRGALFFTPMMLGIALVDKKFTKYRQDKQIKILTQQQQ